MIDLEKIYKEVAEECHKDNCQSVKNIALLAMEKAIEEYKMFIIGKLENFTEKLEEDKL